METIADFPGNCFKFSEAPPFSMMWKIKQKYVKNKLSFTNSAIGTIRSFFHIFRANLRGRRREKSSAKKEPRGIASDREFSIFHIILYIFFHSVDWWGSFLADVTIGRDEKAIKSSGILNEELFLTWALASSYVQWKANVKTFASSNKVKNWAFSLALYREGGCGWNWRIMFWVPRLLCCLFRIPLNFYLGTVSVMFAWCSANGTLLQCRCWWLFQLFFFVAFSRICSCFPPKVFAQSFWILTIYTSCTKSSNSRQYLNLLFPQALLRNEEIISRWVVERLATTTMKKWHVK